MKLKRNDKYYYLMSNSNKYTISIKRWISFKKRWISSNQCYRMFSKFSLPLNAFGQSTFKFQDHIEYLVVRVYIAIIYTYTYSCYENEWL